MAETLDVVLRYTFLMNQEFVIVAVLPESFYRQLIQLRKKFDRWSTEPLPPHITLIRPLRALPEAMRRRTASLEYSFRIVFQDRQAFRNPDASVVWLDPGPEEPRRVADSKLIIRNGKTLIMDAICRGKIISTTSRSPTIFWMMNLQRSGRISIGKT